MYVLCDCLGSTVVKAAERHQRQRSLENGNSRGSHRAIINSMTYCSKTYAPLHFLYIGCSEPHHKYHHHHELREQRLR